MDLSALQQQLREFASERHWQEFHTPKNLAMALMVESAELLEIFQWMTPQQSQVVKVDPVQKAKAADEIADVLLYLLQLADQLGIDIPQAVGQKLLKNAQKHPVALSAQNAVTSVQEVALHGMSDACVYVSEANAAAAKAESADSVHVLIDWENVQPAWSEVQAMVPDCTHVWLLHGPHQKQMDAGYQALGERFTSVPSVQAGKNSLDFQLSFYCGYLASKKGKRLVVVANDLGYEPMIKHAKLLGFDAIRLGVSMAKAAEPASSAKASGAIADAGLKTAAASPRSEPLSKRSTATTVSTTGAGSVSKSMASTAPVKAAVVKPASAKVKPQSAAVPAGLLSPSAAQYAYRLLTTWRENQNRPAKPAALLNAIKAMTRSENLEAPMVQKVYALLQTRGDIRLDESGSKLSYRQ